MEKFSLIIFGIVLVMGILGAVAYGIVDRIYEYKEEKDYEETQRNKPC